MHEYRLTDGERTALVSAAVRVIHSFRSPSIPPSDLVIALAKIAVDDVTVTVQRAYLPGDENA